MTAARLIVIRCVECGALIVAPYPARGVTHSTLTHDDGCAFYAAIETGDAEAWLEDDRYPIRAGVFTPWAAA